MTKEYLLHLFTYDKKNGVLIWRNHWHKPTLTKFKGKKAGSITSPKNNNTRYVAVEINGKIDLVHRIIWFLETGKWPKLLIDHKDGNGLNNKFPNLKEVTQRRNSQNSHRHRSGKLVGASFIKAKNLYMSSVEINKKAINLGYFKTEKEAHDCYMKKLQSENLT